MSNPLLTYAIQKNTNKLVHVKTVLNGNDCNCICPNCNQPLCAKNEGIVRGWHFSHINGSECSGAIESALHLMAKEILRKQKCIMLPSGELIQFDSVVDEKSCEITNLRPDCIGYHEDKALWIEFKKTHAVNQEKQKQIILQKQNCLEVDLNDCELNPKAIEELLIEKNDNREWICNTNYGINEPNDFLIKKACEIIYNKFNVSDCFKVNIPIILLCNKCQSCKYFDKDECYIKKDCEVDLKSFEYNRIEKSTDNTLYISISGNRDPISYICIAITKQDCNFPNNKSYPNTIDLALNSVTDLIDLEEHILGNTFGYKYNFETTHFKTTYTAKEDEVDAQLLKFSQTDDGHCQWEKVSCKELNSNTEALYFKKTINQKEVIQSCLLHYWKKKKSGCFSAYANYTPKTKITKIYVTQQIVNVQNFSL